MTINWLDRLAPPITDIVPTTTGQRLAVAVWPGDGPTFVFAPGLTSNNRNIAAVAAMLDGSMTVVALDLRGRGDSTKPGVGGYGMTAHADDVLAVMDALGIDHAILGGHSMGAYVATTAAVLAPDRADALVLLDGGVLMTVPNQPDPDTLFEILFKPITDRLTQTFTGVDDYRDHLAASPYFELTPIAEEYLRHDLGVTQGGYQPKCLRVAAVEDWRDLLTNPDTSSRLGQVQCPVLAVAAEEGLGHGQPAVLGEPQQQILRASLPDAEIVHVPGTTHHSITLSEHGARAVTDAIAGFVAKLDLAAAAR